MSKQGDSTEAAADAMPTIKDYGGGDYCPRCGQPAHARGYCMGCEVEWTLKKGDGPASPAARCYVAQWQNEHPTEDGYYWYWHPDFCDPVPIRVAHVATDTEYRWDYLPEKYPAEDNEWWLPMGIGVNGPEPPRACGNNDTSSEQQ